MPTAVLTTPDILIFARHIWQLVDKSVVESESATPSRSAVFANTNGQSKGGQSDDSGEESTEGIAIIGMAVQFPGASNLSQFWQLILRGHDCITEASRQRWDDRTFYHSNPNEPNRSYSKWGGFVDDIDVFDPLFFNIAPREAELMDPQQRLFLHQAWLAIENAGYSEARISGTNCGVFVGCSDGDYRNLIDQSGEAASAYTLMGNAGSILAARIAYFLNLRGPCMTVDTACSSSLVAVHLACESLRKGESEIALAGGASALCTPRFHILASKAKMLSPQGRCKTFDKDANGFVPAEGVAAILLKPLVKARADGDEIHAVIKGSNVNQDGRTNGITAPNRHSQTFLETTTYQRFGIEPRKIGYVEAHGTGTALGDPIEVGALTEAFRRHTSETEYCAIGSVKTNIGHTLASAGIAGLIKATLAVREGKLPASLHCQDTNHRINFSRTPFYLLRQTREWSVANGDKRMAAVNSFGFSGTNAHVVVESFPKPRTQRTETAPTLIALSAKTEGALRQRIRDLCDWLDTNGLRWPLYDIAASLAMRRSHFSQRLALVAQSPEDLQSQLKGLLDGSLLPTSSDPQPSESAERDAAYAALSSSDTDARVDALLHLTFAYESGEALEWGRLFDPMPASYPPLPSYPLAKERYWVGGKTPRIAPPHGIETDGSEDILPSEEDNRPQSPEPRIKTMSPSSDTTRERLESDVKSTVSAVLKLDADLISLKANIREFGFDSINITELSQLLNERFAIDVTPPQLFEHKTLASLVSFLLEDFESEIEQSYRQEVNGVRTESPRIQSPPEAMPGIRTDGSHGIDRIDEPIAIIGAGGAMPGSENLEVFWDRLVGGRRLISDVPADRWNWHNSTVIAREGQTNQGQIGRLHAINRLLRRPVLRHLSPRGKSDGSTTASFPTNRVARHRRCRVFPL